MSAPLVAVVGRPNVGKSTLINRIVGRRTAIVEERPGVTRDRKTLDAEWAGRSFRLVDTGGWTDARREPAGSAPLVAMVSEQAERAIATADAVVLVVDATVGVTDDDEAVARLLHDADIPVLLAANKVDDTRREAEVWAFSRLGLGEPHVVSALHGRGSGDLLDALVAALGPDDDENDVEAGAEIGSPNDSDARNEVTTGKPLAVAVVGRPNVGKSTMFNRLVGEERTIVHDEPGTTRDSVDTIVESPEGAIRFIDTAGMRRQARVDHGTEHYSVLRTLESVDRADVALLVVDAAEGVTHQDQRLAERIDVAGTAVVIVCNKWDLVSADHRAQILTDVADRLGFLGYAPVLRTSALTGAKMGSILPALRQAEEAYKVRVPTGELNRVISDAQQRHPPPAEGRHRPRVLYATQGASEPPTFTLFATRRLPATYLRYLERRIRESFDVGPTPLKMRVRVRGE
ncbi:MAG: ribosome biogenesis GTPase Der [Acidimicrobiia bacterium]|nr:ribosome biogenesis GTPase Der [Acidimicrobiia bacterium]